MRHRNGDRDLRALERAYLADPTDLAAYEALLAARLRAGVPVDDPRTPPSSVEAYAILLGARVRSGVTTRPRVVMAARLGHAAARLAAPEWARLGTNRFDAYGRSEAVASLVDKREKVAFACDCVERVLPVFEQAMSGDARPRRAIVAARAWIAAPSKKTADAAYTSAAASYLASAAVDLAVTAPYLVAAAAARAAAAANDADNADDNDIVATLTPAERLWQQERLAQRLVGEVPLPPLPVKKTARKKTRSS